MAKKNKDGAGGGYALLAERLMDGPKLHSETVEIGGKPESCPDATLKVEYDGFRDVYSLYLHGAPGVVQTSVQVYLSAAQFHRLQQAMESVRTRGEGERERLLRKKGSRSGK